MIHIAPLYKTTGDICRTAVRIHMIGSVLGIILQDEYRRFIPDRTLRQGLHKHPHRQIVIGHMGIGCGTSQSQSIRVIIP